MMSRQQIVWTTILAWFLVACGATEPTAVVQSDDVTAVQVVVAANDFEVGQPRIPIIFYDGLLQVADIQQVALTAFDTSADPPAVGWQGAAETYRDYEVPYWVFYPEVPHAGIWGFLTTVTLADGETAEVRFSIMIEESNAAPLVGDRAIPSQNRTAATHPDLAQLSSAHDPNPALYQKTVAEAIDDPRPTVVTFTTPAFCQTAVCAPVLDSVETVYEAVGDRANFIHLEIYKEFEPLVQADEVAQWGLPSEPWTFVLDGDGIVRARLGGPVSPQELTVALQPLLDG